MKKRISLFETIAIIIGTIIGAGIIGIPYVFAQAGFLTGVLVLTLVAVALIIVRLMLGEVILRTTKPHQLTGYTERYLGKPLKQIQGFVLITGIFGSLLAYMVAQGTIMSALLPLDLPFISSYLSLEVFWSLFFYAVFSLLFLQGIDMIKRFELWLSLLMFLVVAVIGFLSLPSVELQYMTGFDLSEFFLPYGVVLFACAGLVSIPAAREALRRHGREKTLFWAIIWGGIIPPVLYLFFAYLVVGVAGPNTDPVATVSLGAVGPSALTAVNIFALFAVSTSFLTLALSLQQIMRFDYDLSKALSAFLVIAVPLSAFALGLRDFIAIISVVGAMTVGVNGLFAVAAWWRARRWGDRQPEYRMPLWLGAISSVFLVILFSLGLIFAFVG